jgi:hypothetical protein
MSRTIRNALIGWGLITVLIVLEFIWIYSRHGFGGFEAFLQEGAYTQIPIALTSVALTWLFVGLLLWLVFTGKITKATSLTWTGFFLIAFLYLNVLRERVRYGDIDYYTQAAFALVRNKPLPDTYFYPPLWASLLSLLTPLGESGILLSAWTANFLSLLLFYFLLQRTLQLYGFRPSSAALTSALFILVNMPVLRTLMYVQVNFHVMNFILLSLLFYRNRPFLSAFMLAMAIHLKASPAVLVLAFLLDFHWKWLAWLAVSLLLIALFPVALYGVTPYYDFVNNFLFISAPHALSMHDSSFDSALGITLSYFRLNPGIIRILVLLAKGLTAFATIFLSVRLRGFRSEEAERIRLFDSVLPLFVGMTLLSPLVWEHHAIFLALPFLLLLKKVESPTEWTWFGAVYYLVFLTPTFDYFPWSYGRLAGILILLALLWTTRNRTHNTFFPRLNAWAENIFTAKLQTETP